MAVVDTRVSMWEALAGRAPGRPTGPAEPGVWTAVVERLNPARARPVLRPGIEQAELVSVRGVPYVMLRSPDTKGQSCYLRLSRQEWQLAQLMDGSRTVARLVAEFARIAGRLAPDQVTRIVADLAGNRMLAELPVDAFRRLDRVHRRPWPVRLGRGLLAAARGRRMVLADVDPLVTVLYKAGGRLLFNPVMAAVLAGVAVLGLLVFGWTWWRGDESLFLTGGSYAAGAAVLLGLNVLALTCHELGHALATKHAGRRVPAAGFLVYFGIPSVFVDTTDVWMAGRRARMVTTVSGPAAGLVLAGLAQIVGALVPAVAPWTFKLAFAWYLNALFNLNPFLALDGYYLLMDWLEIPNLRTRGLAFVAGRIRRRPPAWSQLDREGRLVALYGTLAVLWLVIAVNIGWRIWRDRAGGLVTGLWNAGWGARLLLVAVLTGLASPVVYHLFGVLRRWVTRIREAWTERRHRRDAPRRLDALRRSPLGRLPVHTVAELAARSRWVRPRTGQPLVLAGTAQPDVLVVVDGAVEGRRPGDPGGTVRQRLGAGGVIGLASALSGAPASLTWHTAGTTLLALPAPAVAAAVGPLPGPPPADRIEAESLLHEAPALRGLSPEDRMGLVCAARPAMLAPGAPVTLGSATEAVVVESGVVALADGTELRRGTLIGPSGDGRPGIVATARTPVRLWSLPAVSGLPLLLGTPVTPVDAGPSAGRTAPQSGVHPIADYPPLAAPPEPPDPGADDDVDRRFERRLWWLVLLFLLLALLVTATNVIPGPAWAEMPADRALLTVDRGRVDVVVNGRPEVLRAGGRAYVGAGDDIRVRDRSRGRLVFRGGSATLLCAGSRIEVGTLFSDGRRPILPHGELTLRRGRLVVDTDGDSPAFAPLAATVGAGAAVVSRDAARYTVTAGGVVEVGSGAVDVDGVRQRATGGTVGCGDGAPGPVPTGSPSAGGGDPTTDPEPSDSPTPSPTPSASPTPSPTPSASPSAGPSRSPRPTRTPSSRPPTPTPRPSTPSPSPVDRDPTITGLFAKPTAISRTVCNAEDRATIGGYVDDDVTAPADVVVTASWVAGGQSGTIAVRHGTTSFQGDVVIPYDAGNQDGATVVVTVRARDAAGNSAQATLSIPLSPCYIIG